MSRKWSPHLSCHTVTVVILYITLWIFITLLLYITLYYFMDSYTIYIYLYNHHKAKLNKLGPPPLPPYLLPLPVLQRRLWALPCLSERRSPARSQLTSGELCEV